MHSQSEPEPEHVAPVEAEDPATHSPDPRDVVPDDSQEQGTSSSEEELASAVQFFIDATKEDGVVIPESTMAVIDDGEAKDAWVTVTADGKDTRVSVKKLMDDYYKDEE